MFLILHILVNAYFDPFSAFGHILTIFMLKVHILVAFLYIILITVKQPTNIKIKFILS
jgi:hypothetical protein